MEVRFWTFTKKYNSTKRPAPSEATTYNCVVKNGSSIVDPKIELNIGATNSPSAFNYAYITQFQRYYYVREWSFENGLWIGTLATDVLATYKSQIGAANLYILRASAEKDGRIIDNLYPTKVNCDYDTTELQYPYTTGYYVVGCVTKQPQGTGSITYYALNYFNMRRLVQCLLSDVINTDNHFNLNDASEALQLSIVDPVQYIKSCLWFPFDISVQETLPVDVSVDVYGWSFPDVTGRIVDAKNRRVGFDFATIKHPDTNARGNYVNCAPYTKATLNFPPFGTIDIDTTVICNTNNIHASLNIDMINGEGILRLTANDILLNEIKSQIGVPIHLSQVNRDYIGAATSFIGGIAGGIGSIMTGNIAGGIGSIANGIGDAAKAAIPRAQSLGSNGSFAGLDYSPRLDFQFYRPVEDDNDHNGRPLCKVRNVATLGGYMLVQDGDVPINGTQGEGEQVRAFLEGGFYYE